MPSGHKQQRNRRRSATAEAEKAKAEPAVPAGGDASEQLAAMAAQCSSLPFPMQCKILQLRYAAVGRAEWWWLMDDSLALIGAELNREGYCVLDGFLTDEQAKGLRREVEAAHGAGRLHAGGLVNGKLEGGGSKYTNASTRGDLIGWFDKSESEWPYGGGLDSYLTKVGTLVTELGKPVPELATMTGRSKAMVACYPGEGARYVRHVDNDGKHTNCRTRLLTALIYLNDGWKSGDGGELVVFSPDMTRERAVVEPIGNRMVFFWSDRRTPHEVRPAHRRRYAVTLWLLNNRLAAPPQCGDPPAALPERPAAPAALAAEPAPGGRQEVGTPAAAGVEVRGVGVCYSWHFLEAAAELDGGLWELRVQVADGGCPALEMSDAQIRVTSADGGLLLCVPLPFALPRAAPAAPSSKWSRRQRLLTVGFQPPPCSAAGAGAASSSLAAQLRTRGWGLLDAFLLGADADALLSYVLKLRRTGCFHVGESASGPSASPLRTCIRSCCGLVGQLAREEIPTLTGADFTLGQPMVAVNPGGGARGGGDLAGDAAGRGDGGGGCALTLVVYLNPFWREGDGGGLRLPGGPGGGPGGSIDVAPLHGRLVGLLGGGACPHEELPAWASGTSLVFRCHSPCAG